MRAKFFCLCVLLIFSMFAFSCGGDGTAAPKDTPPPQLRLGNPPPPQGTLQSDVTIPGFPNQIDFYVPSVAERAVVFLHGGGGHNYGLAYSLGINGVNGPPVASSVDWNWLNANKIIAVFPQGQAIPQAPLAYTWENHVMTSGQDDAAFLNALASYIRGHYPVTHIYLAGHSNGGMMANRMWCEQPSNFDAYITMSGPASSYYLSASTPCLPGVVRPYYGIVGGQDNLLNVTGNFDKQTWVMTPPDPDSPSYVNKVLIGEWYQQVTTRAPLMCNETPSIDDGITSGGVETWTNCSGRLELQEILAAGHSVDSLQSASGLMLRDLIVSFINQLP